ncbi:uncharacterized protein LOC105287244 isoform X2 [Ooceraea biroi]|uniref:uncharacterized protein LOC105287244 isoform X2 n=1 Tax=Ooceraea biroi TaxID=2015173 RepID=UPI000F0857D9|nr:uncharacterized protein LOC105287244 isoform X2 [Ooceraea biroi]
MAICVVQQYFSINKILFRAVALWPYHRTKLVEFHLTFFLVILISFIAAQLATFLTTECTPHMAIKIFSLVLYFTLYLINYLSFRVNAHTIGCLLEKFQYICDELTDEGEIAIIKEYGNEAKRFTVIISLYGMFNILTTCLLPVFPRILRTFTSTNVSEKHFMIHIPREYFIDQEKYYYCILLHMDVSLFMGAIVLVATGTLLFGCMKYMCGLFRIASYRIDQTMKTPMFQIAGLSKDYVIYKTIVHAIDIHRKAIEVCDIIKSNFVGMSFILMLISVTSLSLNLYGLHQAVMFGNATEEYLVYAKGLFVTLLYIFICNYIGQELTDHYNHMFISIVQWYVTPLHIQKIILFLLQRGTKNFYFVFGGILVMSIENATTVKLFHVMSCYKNISNYNLPTSMHFELKNEKYVSVSKRFHIVFHRSPFYAAT